MQIGVTSDAAVANFCVFVISACEIKRTALQFMLQDDYETHEWSELDQALGRMRERPPDVAIVDRVELGDADARLMDRIREISPKIQVVVLVGSISEPEGACWLAQGAHSLLPQPLTVEAVRRKVRLALGLRAAIGIGVGTS
jgi:DNA-binding NtrC family response regulator